MYVYVKSRVSITVPYYTPSHAYSIMNSMENLHFDKQIQVLVFYALFYKRNR